MDGKGSSTRDRQGISQRRAAAAFKWGNLLRWAFAGLAAGLMVVGMYHTSVAAVIELADACDVTVVAPGKGVPGDPKVIEAASGDTIRLTENSECDPVIGNVFDPRTKTTAPGLVSGDGISIAAPGVILDLNGHNITSTKDILGEAAKQGLDVENAGVSVAAPNVTVTNSNATVATIDNFTAEFDFGKGSDHSMLIGGLFDLDRNPATPMGRVQNLVGTNDHGGGVLAIDRTQNIWVDSVKLLGMNETNGTSGIDMKRCTGPGIVIQNSYIEGILGGVRMKSCRSGGYMLIYNYISSPGGDGVLITGGFQGVMISYNTIEDNAFNGVTVGSKSESISIFKNTIQNNLGCGIQVSKLGTKKITTAPNTFANNGLPPGSGPAHTVPVAGQDVCFK